MMMMMVHWNAPGKRKGIWKMRSPLTFKFSRGKGVFINTISGLVFTVEAMWCMWLASKQVMTAIATAMVRFKIRASEDAFIVSCVDGVPARCTASVHSSKSAHSWKAEAAAFRWPTTVSILLVRGGNYARISVYIFFEATAEYVC